MSFFVSESLEGQIDESCLMATEKTGDQKEFVLVLEKLECKIVKLRFKKDDHHIKYVDIKCEANIHVVENIFLNRLKGVIYFKEKKIEVFDFKIHEILKQDSDSYIIELSSRYEV